MSAHIDALIEQIDEAVRRFTTCASCERQLPPDGRCRACDPVCEECGESIRLIHSYPDPEDGLCAVCVERHHPGSKY